MSLTYPEPPASGATEAEYIPAYARKPVRRKKVRSWMILAPIGAVVLIGAGAAMLMTPGTSEAPLAEPEAAPAAMAPAPIAPSTTAMETAPAALPAAPVESAPIAPVARPEADRPAPVRRVAPVQRPAAPSVAPRVEPTPVEPTGPRPYSTSPEAVGAGTANLNATPPATPAPTPAAPPAPAISTRPLG